MLPMTKARAKMILRSVKNAQCNLINDIANFAMGLAPAADLIGDDAPEHVRLAKAIQDLPDDADDEALALQFLFAVLALKM